MLKVFLKIMLKMFQIPHPLDARPSPDVTIVEWRGPTLGTGN